MRNIRPSFARAALLFTLCELIHACAPKVLPQRPPENYKGPIAEGPLLRADEYWIYRRPDGTRIKAGSGTLGAPVEFPLWIGRAWTYRTGVLPMGQPETSKAYRPPVDITCEVTAFKTVSVAAGRFESFECQCECRLAEGAGIYEADCGRWTIWYAPQVKNVVKIKSESTAHSMELLEYKVPGDFDR